MIDPDGSNEIPLQPDGIQPGIWSRDVRQLVASVLVDAKSHPMAAGDGWERPATMSTDGSGFKVLDAYPGRKLNLVAVGWSADESRIYVMSGYDAVDLGDIGLFSVRASDGGGLTSVVAPPPGDAASGIAGKSCSRPDAVQVSPDGSKLLVNRQTPRDVCGTLLVFTADGRGGVRLNPEGTIAEDIDFGDFLERGRISESWSHDGARIAFGAYVVSADSTALYVARPDGSDVRQIVPTSVGAISAAWSPDDSWIAFTSRLRSSPQVWLVHPDGSGLVQLTHTVNGSTSVMPVWSPDGSKLLYQTESRGHVTLWTMNADGSGASQLFRTPLSADYFGPYAWWPAPVG
jgi:Tol biopolymer transport system component